MAAMVLSTQPTASVHVQCKFRVLVSGLHSAPLRLPLCQRMMAMETSVETCSCAALWEDLALRLFALSHNAGL